MSYQLELNAEAARLEKLSAEILAKVTQFDGDIALHGMPSYSQLARSLQQAVKTIDILLAAYDKGANPEHFAAIARLDLRDIELRIGDITR